MDLSPLAPSLEALLRFAAATEELTASRGLSASQRAGFGPKAVTEASDRLAAVFEGAAGDEVAGVLEDGRADPAAGPDRGPR